MTASSTGPSLRRVGRSALILTGGSLAVQLVALGRELFVAAQVGLSRELDALLIALVLPLSLSGVLTSGTITALVPAYLEARSSAGPRQARRLAGAVLTLVATGAILVTISLIAFAGPVVAIAGPGLSEASRDSAVGYLRLLAPVALFSPVAGILTSLCQAEERFAPIALATLSGPATTLVVLVLLWGPLGLGAYALGHLLGPMVTTAVLLVATVRASIAPLLIGRVRGLGLGAFLSHALPLTMSGAILQINVIGDRAIASLIGPGAVSALRYGEVLIRTPITAIAPAWSSALYPAQVRAAGHAIASRLGATTGRSIAYALVAFVPVAILAVALAPLAVEVAFGRGKFGASEIAVTTGVVAAFGPLILVMMVSPVLAGAHNARRRGGVLLATGVMNVIMNITLDLVLGGWLGVAGIALSSSITGSILVGFLAVRLARAEDDFPLRQLALTTVRALGAIALPAAAVTAIAWSGVGRGGGLADLLLLIPVGLAAAIVYTITAIALGIEEIPTLLRLVAQRLRLPRQTE